MSKPIKLADGVTVEVMFSPNTNKTLASPPKEVPNDMQRVFDLIADAKEAVLFLAFVNASYISGANLAVASAR